MGDSEDDCFSGEFLVRFVSYFSADHLGEITTTRSMTLREAAEHAGVDYPNITIPFAVRHRACYETDEIGDDVLDELDEDSYDSLVKDGVLTIRVWTAVDIDKRKWECDICFNKYLPETMDRIRCNECSYVACEHCLKKCQCNNTYCEWGELCLRCSDSAFLNCTHCEAGPLSWCGNDYLDTFPAPTGECCCIHRHLKKFHIVSEFTRVAESLWKGFPSPVCWREGFQKVVDDHQDALNIPGSTRITFKNMFCEVVAVKELNTLSFNAALAELYAITVERANFVSGALPRLTREQCIGIFETVIEQYVGDSNRILRLEEVLALVEERTLPYFIALHQSKHENIFSDLPKEIKQMIVLMSVLPAEEQFNLLLV